MKNNNTTEVRPRSVFLAAKFQVHCVIFSLVALLFDFYYDSLSPSSFYTQFLLSIVYLIFPFMILRGNDFFRFLFVVLECVTIVSYLTSDLDIPTFSTVALFCQMPLIGYILFSLFTKESNDWFDFKRLNKSIK